MLGVSVLDVAKIPTDPSSPKPLPLMLGAFVLGLMGAVLAAIGVDRLRNVFDASQSLRERLGTNVLGQIPRSCALRDSQASLTDVLTHAPANVVEAFQQLRTNLEVLIFEERPGAIAITSYGSGEGKSTIAAALGVLLATVGHSVLLVDADLRHSVLATRFGKLYDVGLADLVSENVEATSIPTAKPGLRLLPAGTPDRHPADVMSLALPRALDLRHENDALVLIDCPPLTGAAETPGIVHAAGYVILVIDAASVRLGELDDSVARLREAGVVVLGVVVNRVRPGRRSRKLSGRAVGVPGSPGEPPGPRAAAQATARPASQRERRKPHTDDDPDHVRGPPAPPRLTVRGRACARGCSPRADRPACPPRAGRSTRTRCRGACRASAGCAATP